MAKGKGISKDSDIGKLWRNVGENSCIYLFYIKRDAAASFASRAYYWFDRSIDLLDPADLTRKIEELSQNARIDGDHPPCHGDLFSDLRMKRKDTFYVVVVDDAKYKFSSVLPLYIVTDEINSVRASHTFSDSYRLDLDMTRYASGPNQITAGVCRNYLKNKDGNVLKGVDPAEPFKLYLNPILPRIVPDSGGTNMGPPVPPP